MKSLLLILLLLVASLSFAQRETHVPGEVLVKFRPGAGFARSLSTRLIRGREIKEFRQIGVVHVRLPQGLSVSDAIDHYQGFAGVVYAEPNYISYLDRIPNDPEYPRQYAPKRIQAEQAWDLTTGDPGVIIAVIDTGADLAHPDLQGKLVPGYDFADNDPDVSDPDGHGTHCVGNIGAATNNATGIAGIAYDCKIMPLKVFPSAGGGAPNTATMSAITHAANNNAKVISMSIGSYFYSQAYQDTINDAWRRGLVILASAGNDNISDPHYPSDYENVISVGATDSGDQKAGFSNFGGGVDVAAPGVGILSTVPGGNYENYSGTSMSCPVAAGVAGLCFAYGGSEADNVAVRTAIEGTTENVGTWLKFGRVNAARAVDAVAPLVEVAFGPTGVAMETGTAATGTLSTIQTADNVRFTVRSKGTSLGQVASSAVTLGITQPLTQLRRLQLQMKSQAVKGSTNTVFLYNWNTEGYDYYKAFFLSAADQVHTVSIGDVGTYVSPSGEIRMVTRAHVPRRRGRLRGPFTFKVDEVKLVGAFKSR